MPAFEPPLLGSPAKRTRTTTLGGLMVAVPAVLFVVLVGGMILGTAWAQHRAARFCSAAPAVGARIDPQALALDALDRGANVSFSVRDEARREAVLDLVFRTPRGSRHTPAVFVWPERSESVTAYWRMSFFTSNCLISYEGAVVTVKRVFNLG